VQQETAAHASAGGLLDRLRGALSRAVVGEDVVQQVHAALCGLNVLQQALERSLIVVQQLDAIAARQIEAAEVAGETSRLGDLDRQVRGDLRRPGQSLGDVLQELDDARLFCQTAARNVGTPDQRVQHQAQRGEKEDQQ